LDSAIIVVGAPPAKARTLAPVQAAGVLKVGLTVGFAPYALRAADGIVAGADVVMARR
jgi:hypothetical protein